MNVVDMTTEMVGTIFDSCDANRSGDLDFPEAQYALQSFGLYPTDEEITKSMMEMNSKFPLKMPAFRKITEALEKTNCKRGLRTVPYSRRGITLLQLKNIQAGLLDTKWLPGICEKFNRDNKGTSEYKKMADLYALDEYFVKKTTKADPNERSDIPQDVLITAQIPDVPESDCCFAQLLNPDGLAVDFFVSHYWGHDFKNTVLALTTFAEGIYEELGKKSPDDVVFWICLFALNQHQAAEEVGLTPEDGPFNAALANAKHGAVMVLDENAEPLQRIWCLFEVSRAKEFGREFRLITDTGDLVNASVETLEEISGKLLQVSAYNADASFTADKHKIHWRIVDPIIKSDFTTFENFKVRYDFINETYFEEFDIHICALMGTPLLTAGLKSRSKEVCARALGMGATVTVSILEELTEIGVDTTGEFETRIGTVGLTLLFSSMGMVDEVRHVLDKGGNVDEKNERGDTALHKAAFGGHTDTASLLLEKGADVDAKNEDDSIALHLAAMGGHTDTVSLLLEKGADIEAKDNDNLTALNLAAMYGHTDSVSLLLEKGADIDAKNDEGYIVLHCAAANGQTETVLLLLEKVADIDAKNNDGNTALHLAARRGHMDTASLLLEKGADIDAKNNDGKTALELAAIGGHTKTNAVIGRHEDTAKLQ